MDLSFVFFLCVAIGIYFQVLRAAIKDVKPVTIVFGIAGFIALLITGYFIFFEWGYWTIAYSIYFLWALLLVFVLIEREHLLDKVTEEKLLIDTLLVWFVFIALIKESFFILGSGVYIILLFMLWQTAKVLINVFTKKRLTIGQKAGFYYWNLLSNFVILGILAASTFLVLNFQTDFVVVVINSLVFGLMLTGFMATAIEMAFMKRTKRESSFSYESRVKKNFLGENSRYVDIDSSTIIAITIIIVLLAIFVSSIVFNLFSIYTVIVMVIIIRQLILAAKPPTTSASNN